MGKFGVKMDVQTRLQALEQMLAESPDDCFLEYGIALEIAKTDTLEAVAKLMKLIQKSPNYLPSYYRLGVMLAETDQNDKAVEFLANGLELAIVQNDTWAAKELRAFIEELTF